MKETITILLVILISTNCIAQNQKDFQQQGFYPKQTKQLNTWLFSNSISEDLLQALSFENSEDKVLLKMKVKDIINWNNLSEKSLAETGERFSESLFHKSSFLVDIMPSQLIVEIEGTDCFIFLSYAKGIIEEDKQIKMGDISDGHKIPIGNLNKLISAEHIETGEDLDLVKDLLQSGLKVEFKKYKTKFEKYSFQVLSSLDNHLIITVSNVTDLILEEGYFEFIRLHFDFETKTNFLLVDYRIQAKYGAGIIWAPKSTDYDDMESEFPNQLSEFNLKLKNLINQLLSKE